MEMSIFIKSMEMPEGCLTCRLLDYSKGYRCMINQVLVGNIRDGKRSESCPLVPVPPHGRLIDKDALEADISASVVFSGRDGNAEIVGAKKIINRLHLAPTVIPAEEGE